MIGSYHYTKGPVESKLLAIAVLALVYLLLVIWMHYPDAVEDVYSQNIYPAVCRVFHPVFNLVPFSVGDVLYIILVIYLLYAFFKLIRLLFLCRFRLLLINVLKDVIGLQVVILSFYFFWGMNYFRPSAAVRLGLQDTSYTFEDIKTIARMLIDSANMNRGRLTAADLQQTNSVIYNSASHAVDTLSMRWHEGFPAYHPRVKPSLLTWFMNYLGTEGYFNPFTSEAQANYQMPVFLRPFTACHEMSHQMGFGAEDEANFGGFAAGVASHDKLLRYSAYYTGMEEFMFAVFRQDSLSYKKLKVYISPAVRTDRLADRAYWKSFESRAGIFSSILYDHYLKSNNQPQGLKTYNRMIRLVMAWYRKQQRVKQY